MLGVNLFGPSQYQSFPLLRGPWQQSMSQPVLTDERDPLDQPADPFAKVQRILSHRLSAVTAPSEEAIAHTGQESAFDAESVANNILGMIQRRLKQAEEEGADQTQLDGLREQAKTGIEQGIKEAREVLEGLGMLTEPVQLGIDQLQQLLSEGLAGDSKNPVSSEQPVRFESLQQLTRQRVETSFELEINTRDGDIVKLRFQQLDSREDVAAYQASAEGEAYAVRHSVTSMTQYALSVEGELDEAELSAISDLATKLQQLSDDFFTGDAATAFEQGLQLGFDPEQIAGFAFELQQSRSSSAVTRYQQIDALDTRSRPSLPGLNQVGDLFDELNGLLEQVQGAVADARRLSKGLLGGFLSQHPQAGDFSERAHLHDHGGMKRLSESLVDKADRSDRVAHDEFGKSSDDD